MCLEVAALDVVVNCFRAHPDVHCRFSDCQVIRLQGLVLATGDARLRVSTGCDYRPSHLVSIFTKPLPEFGSTPMEKPSPPAELITEFNVFSISPAHGLRHRFRYGQNRRNAFNQVNLTVSR